MPSMQYDVKSAYTTTDAALVPYRVRLKGAFITSETGGATPGYLLRQCNHNLKRGGS